MRMSRNVLVIQKEYQGIVECPEIFYSEENADNRYLQLINEVYHKKFKNINDALKFVQLEVDSDYDTIIRYWTGYIEDSDEE